MRQALGATLLAFALPAPGDAQETGTSSNLGPVARALRCPKPESPRFRLFECNGVEPDFERTLLSDWNGIRRDLAALGINATSSYVGAYFGNTSNAPRDGSYGGGLHGSVNVDFAKLAGVRGLSAYMDVWWMQASHIDAIVNTGYFPANNNVVGNGFWVGQMYVQQTFADADVTVAAGRLGPANAFSTLPVFANYVNLAMDPDPASIRLNDPSFDSPPPGVQWGAQALVKLAPAWRLDVGIFNNNPNATAGRNHGLDLSFREGNRGVLAVAQLDWHRNQEAHDTGLPGQYNVGVFFDSNDFATVSGTPAGERNNVGLYVMGQQKVRPSCGSAGDGGVTLWGALAYGTRQNINPVPLFAGVGASCEGTFPGRPRDVASFGWYYADPSSKIEPPATHSQAVELNYQYTINAALNVTLDAQYLFRLNGYPSRGTMVLGTQFSVTF